MFGVPVALSGNHRVIYIFTCLQRWIRTRKQKEWIVGVLDVYSVFFQTPVVPRHGGGSGGNVLLMLRLQAKLPKLSVRKTRTAQNKIRHAA